MPKAIVIGASTGIGRALAIALSNAGYSLGITARREDLLLSLQSQIPTTKVKIMDIAQPESARQALAELVTEMGGLDLIVINAAVGYTGLTWEENQEMIQINVMGNIAIADWAVHYFKNQKSGHLVGISSVAALHAFRTSIVYSASKSFLSAYLQGVRHFFLHKKLPVTITDIRPGFVTTFMTAQNDPKQMFWVSDTETAAHHILKAIQRRKRIAYITPRWWLIGQIIRLMPNRILDAF